MGVPNPEDMFPQLAAALNSGDIDAALALYEDDAGFVTAQGGLARGAAGLRGEFEAMIAAKVTTVGMIAKSIIVKDVALVFVEFSSTIPTPDGKTLEFGGLSTAVLRRQPVGTWLSVIDNPYGTALVTGTPVPQEVLDAASR